MKKLILSFIFLIAVISAFAFNAQATLIYGYTSFSGTFQSDSGFLDLATTFEEFSDVVVSTNGGTYDYAAIPGNEAVALSTFTFVPDVNTEISNFWVITYGGIEYRYDLLTSEVEFATANSIAMKGTGIASITGFEDTDSIWFLSATSAGDRSTFTLSTLVPPDYQAPSDVVPEPATVILFGLGLLGFAGLARKKS
ncbi:MAG: hypothetical protein A2464_14655 [Deltaproteobacteria bacterium RIFOXYC2_FULL_48_10]|nr:MAG: hypothetical protein A2464_14655 [Deltaproteobacteria bacterium RIFOXYC2_FULL_48_10]